MADECISVKFPDQDQWWDWCWENTTPEPTWKVENVTTGLRKGQGADARAWRTCQYYLKGMPAICSHWEQSDGVWACNNGSASPTGFNNGVCDNLGRRSWCDKYNPSTTDNLDEWICAAPNGYLTGLGERAEGLEAPIIRVLSRSEIYGYNDDGNGVGLCDCNGYGRGPAGCNFVSTNTDEDESSYGDTNVEANLLALPVVCNYYRPWTMGFGAITPRPRHKELSPDDEMDAAIASMDEPVEYRLPLSVVLFNNRARFQKCNYWEEDYASEFILSGDSIIIEEEAVGDPFDGNGRIEMCKCTNSAADDYNHRIQGADDRFLTGNVLAIGGGLICNGARPECPCYTGKWTHCTQDKMTVGMPVTANQILELRFWTADWETRKQYDKFFDQRSNLDDPATSDIYTFTRWDRRSQTAIDNRMIGKKLNLCFPVVGENKEFTDASIFVKSPITYAPSYIETGTTTSTQRHFPTLIRLPEFEEIKPFAVDYPPYSDNPPHSDDSTIVDCGDDAGSGYLDDAGHLKRNNDIYGDSSAIIGHGVRNKMVYAINSSELHVDAIIKNYTTMFNVPDQLKDYVLYKLAEAAYSGLTSGSEYFVSGACDSIFGYYVLPPIKLKYNQGNKILVMIDFGDGKWEFRWRIVNSLWCGGVITQTNYNHTYPDDSYNNDQPLGLTPAASAQFKMESLNGCSASDLISVYSHENQGIYSVRYYSYSIISTEKTITEEDESGEEGISMTWWALGNSNMIHTEIEDLNLNYIYDWDIISAKMIPTTERIKELEEKGQSTEPIPMEQYKYDENDDDTVLDRHTVPPNYKLLKPVDSDNVRHRFFSSEWYLEIEYWYEELITEDPFWLGDDVTIKHGAGKTDLDRYVASPVSIDYTFDYATVNNIDKGTVNLMAHFNDDDGRLISTMATKACLNIVKESCRNIEIFYAYKAQGTKYYLQPDSGFCINIAADKPDENPYMHAETPDCGDHLHYPWLKPGPQWFPFDNCRGYDMYDEWTICNNCQTGYVGPMNDGVEYDSLGNPQLAGNTVIKRKDYRYCGPYKYYAFGEVRSVNAIAACNCGCRFAYSDATESTVIFAGYGNIKPAIDVGEYKAQGWRLPPFGNNGRETIEKFISQDFTTHPTEDGYRSEWMPMVMDNSMFFMSFNAFDSNPEDIYFTSVGNGLDPFYYVNQMNFLLLQSVNENIDFFPTVEGAPPPTEKRYRFDDLFEVHHEAICSYPLPGYPISGGKTKVIFYYLKPTVYAGATSDITWAWQEFWRDIERGQDLTLEQAEEVVEAATSGLSESEITDRANKLLIDSGHLDFVRAFNKPEYVFSYYKEEHRLITGEGAHYIEYTAPIIDEEGNIAIHATISIDGQWPRPFKIVYGSSYDPDNYRNEQVEWMNEGGEANVDGSSQEDNIYEKVQGGEWLHHDDAIFSEASDNTTEAGLAGREVVVGVDDITSQEIKRYYNRGLVVDIPKSRLDHLPKTEKTFVYDSNGTFVQEGGDSPEALNMQVSEEYEPDLEENEPLVQGNYVWENTAIFDYTTASGSNGINLYGLRIVGLWGVADKVTSVKPSISITATYQDSSTGIPRMFNSLPTDFSYKTGELDVYVIETQFLLGPIEMLKNRMTGFTFTLEGSAAGLDFLSIQDIRLTTAEYTDGKTEPINVWERKYISSEYDKAPNDINPDASDNLYRDTDNYNAGLYFPIKGAGDRSRPDEELKGLNKTKAIYTGLLYTTSESVEITYDNLQNVEEFEQQRLYDYAIERDYSGNTLSYQGIMPYKVTTFLENLGIPWNSREAQFNSEALLWEKHELYKQLVLYDYWRPGGHYYRWAGSYEVIKCMLFGGTEDFFSAEYVHVDHQGVGTPLEQDASKPIDILNSFGSLRHYTQIAKYDRAMILAGGDPEYTDKWTASTPYNGLSFIRTP